MIRLSINLPKKLRLDLHLVKKRKGEDIPLLPDLGEVLRARKGNKVSRYFRHVFEQKRIKRILGANLAAAVIATSLLPQSTSVSFPEEENILTQAPLVLKTEVAVRYPINDVKISQGYRFYHPGIDLDGTTGDNIYPVMDGEVKAIQYSKVGYGNAVYIVHSENLSSLYAHLSKINVAKDQEVTTKDVIGKLGATGRAYGDHLHLEIRENDYPINPHSILP